MTIAESNEPVAAGLKSIIAKKGLKNVHVAMNAGYSAQELSDMLNGRRIIKVCDIANLSKALDTKYDEIFATGLEEEMN